MRVSTSLIISRVLNLSHSRAWYRASHFEAPFTASPSWGVFVWPASVSACSPILPLPNAYFPSLQDLWYLDIVIPSRLGTSRHRHLSVLLSLHCRATVNFFAAGLAIMLVSRPT